VANLRDSRAFANQIKLRHFVISATCALIKHGELLVANLGDSRAVASVGGTVKQLTQALKLAQNI
jgi:serine/threonine protein phosphatase PrpC